jgi:hypothetical protein
MVNCTIAENMARAGNAGGTPSTRGYAQGGAIAGEATLVNVTLARNAIDPAGDWGGGSSIYGHAILTNTILFCLARETNVMGSIEDGGHNICSDNSAGFSSPTSRNNLDALLGPVANNGGFTPTVAISPTSPAVSAADPAVSPPTDQRGVRRPAGAGYDIGAFELAPTLALHRQADGMRLLCYFEPAQTNQFEATDNFIQWLNLGSAVSDSEGRSELEDPRLAQFPLRFYRVQIRVP